MADKCFDVICLSCGREWCLLGCAYNDKPSKERLDAYNKQKQKLADEYHNGKVIHTFADHEICLCSSSSVCYN
jgi:hypothetical protein